MSINLIILIGMVVAGLMGFIVSAFTKSLDTLLFSTFLFFGGGLSIGVLLTL